MPCTLKFVRQVFDGGMHAYVLHHPPHPFPKDITLVRDVFVYTLQFTYNCLTCGHVHVHVCGCTMYMDALMFSSWSWGENLVSLM